MCFRPVETGRTKKRVDHVGQQSLHDDIKEHEASGEYIEVPDL
jgi:hypothetical protein